MNAYSNYLSFVVDPQRDGISNALWKAVTGTPTVASNRFRFNAQEGLVRADVFQGRYEFSVIYPLTGVQTPTNLVNDIEFGLKNLSLGNKGIIQVLADQSADEMVLNTGDRNGTLTTTHITWQTAWNGASTRFVIDWFSDRIRLSVINTTTTVEVVLAEHSYKSSPASQFPLNPYVKTVGAENFDVDYIVVDKSKTNSIMLI